MRAQSDSKTNEPRAGAFPANPGRCNPLHACRGWSFLREAEAGAFADCVGE